MTDVLLLYAQERAPLIARPEMVGPAIKSLGAFFAGKSVGQIDPISCRAYVTWRCAQPQARFKDKDKAPRVGAQTARRELETLSAAIGFAYKARRLNYVVPVALPKKSEPRDRWLSRDEVAKLLRACLHADQGKARHLAKFILIALYTGTRLQATLRLRWTPSIDGGWIDLDRAMIYRKGSREAQTNKRRTPAPISGRLMAHLRRWKRLGDSHVIEFETRAKRAGGEIEIRRTPVASIKRAWRTARIAAGLDEAVTPHCLRHTFAAWSVQSGVSNAKIAAALGTTEQVVQDVYGHHAPERLREVVEAVARRGGR